MACNGNKHSADCNCGWGGVNYGTGNITMSNAYNQIFQIKEKAINKNIYREFTKKEYKNFIVPNVECNCCKQLIFFYQSPYGGKVFFEELGPPWKKHCCEPKCCASTKNNIPKKISQSNLTLENINPTWEKDKWTFCLSIREQPCDSNVKKIIIKSMKNNIEYSFFIQKKYFELELKYGLPIYFRQLLNDRYFEISFYSNKESKEQKVIVGKYPSNYDLENFINNQK